MADIALEQLLHTAGDNTLSTTDGALHGYMRGTDGTTTRTVKTDADGNIIISPGLGTEATLAAVKAVLDSLDGKDYATQATLAEVLAKLADPATATKQDAAKTVLDAISTAVAARASEATLEQIKTALTDGTLKAQLSGSLVDNAEAVLVRQKPKHTMETLISAESVAAGKSTNYKTVNTLGATHIILAVAIDKQPWKVAITNQPWSSSDNGNLGTYPTLRDSQTAIASSHYPKTALLLTTLGQSVAGMTMADARAANLYPDSFQVAARNDSTETATITVKIWRIWR